MWCESASENAKTDLLPAVKKLYNFAPTKDKKPKMLWSLYYNQVTFVNDIRLFPGLKVVSPPVCEIDYDFAISEVGFKIFTVVLINFLPNVPN